MTNLGTGSTGEIGSQGVQRLADRVPKKPRLVGINHLALEVGDIDQALDFYGKIFDFTLRGKRPGNAFIELGDQFINLMETPTPHEDRLRHFGLVVDDRSSA